MIKESVASSAITLTVAVTGHSEGRLLRPTLRSVAAAIDELVKRSITCELLIVLDNATPETLHEAEHWEEPGRVSVPVRIVRQSEGDAGASRNAAARIAHGTYVAFCDGDDLVSRNYFTAALDVLSEAEGPLIVHPNMVVSFGARSAVWRIPATETIDHLDLIRNNLWPSSSVSRRETYLENPYAQFDSSEGFGPEDWLWNIETSIAGIPHRPAPNTLFFYRVRERGGVNNRHAHSLLPWFDIDRLASSLPRITRATVAAPRPTARIQAKAVIRRGYRIARPGIRLLTAGMSQATKVKLVTKAREIYHGPSPVTLTPPVVVSALRDASELEPALSWTAHGFVGLPEWIPSDDHYASLLVSLVDQLRGKAEALVAVPWVGVGGADLVSLNYARALVEGEKHRGKVTMLATYTPSRTNRNLIPDGVNFVQVPESFRALTPDHQRRLLAQVFIMVRPELIVSVNCFDVTNSLQLYGRQMGLISRIFLTLFAFDRIGAGYPVNPITDDSQREYLDDIRAILTDNSVTAGIVQDMLALDAGKLSVQYQPAMDHIPELRTGTRAYNNRHFSDKNPFVLLWPHRLDKEKRPDVLVELARRVQSQQLPVQIHVYGQQVLSVDGDVLMKSLAAAGIVYHGPYHGGLSVLPTEDYHALLLTSESEGLPLVLVQSMLLGLPVISTAVGGVTDVVRDRDTGLLARDPDDIDGFVTAISYLMNSLEDRRRIIHSAHQFAASQHGWPTFRKLVEDTFG